MKKSSEKPVRLIGRTLTLERWNTDQPDSSAVPGYSIVVTGVTQDIDLEDDLILLLENKRKGGGPVESARRLSQSQSEDSVLVTFGDQSSMEFTSLASCIY